MKNLFPQVLMLFTVKTWNQRKIIWYIKSKSFSVEWIIWVPRKGRHYFHTSKWNKEIFLVYHWLLGVHKGQDQQSKEPPSRDCQWTKWRFTGCWSRRTLACMSGSDGGVLGSRTIAWTWGLYSYSSITWRWSAQKRRSHCFLYKTGQLQERGYFSQ